MACPVIKSFFSFSLPHLCNWNNFNRNWKDCTIVDFLLFGRLRTLQSTKQCHFLRVWTHHPWCGHWSCCRSGQRHARRHSLFRAHYSRWHQTFFSPCKVLRLPCGKRGFKWRKSKMSEDSWAVAVDVQEATAPSSQVALHFKGDFEKSNQTCSSFVSSLARRAT